MSQNIEDFKLLMLRTQQDLWTTKKRAIIIFEGSDAAGKGTCIRHLTSGLDPRSIKVIPIGKPTEEELGQHYLQRFWKNLPSPGTMTIFDRSWYGRVLVEKVEKLAPLQRIKEAYQEINEFEKMLSDDGIFLVKIFLDVSKKEQLKRFKARLKDPFKRWKITPEDVRNRKRWNDYQKAYKTIFKKCPGWYVIPSDDKPSARLQTIEIVSQELAEVRNSFKPDPSKMDRLTKELQGT